MTTSPSWDGPSTTWPTASRPPRPSSASSSPTPGTFFDYDDEEAFVRYDNRLPSQNYVEELRMYPRTGSNIPEHVNDALQDWNY